MSVCYRDLNSSAELVSRDESRMFPRVSPTGRIAWKSHDGGYAFIDGMSVGETLGNWPCAWGPDDTLYVQQDQSGFLQRFRFADNTWEPFGKVEAIYMSEGIHHIEPDGTPVMGGGLHLTMNAVELWNAMRDELGNWTGLSNGGNSVHGCVALVEATGSAFMWPVPDDVPFPPRISEGRVAISATFETPAPDAIPWVPFQIYTPAAPVVDQPVNPRPMLRGGFGLNLINANVGGSGHPQNVIDGFPYIMDADKPKLKGILWTPFEPRDVFREQSVALSKATGAPIVAYGDGHSVLAEMEALERDGVAVIHAFNAYPGIPWQPSGNRPALMVRAGYFGWTDEELAASYRAIDAEIEQPTPGYLGELIFGTDRKGPQACPPWAQQYLDTRIANTPMPNLSHWPRTTIPAPLPPQSQPEPPKPTPAPPVHGWKAFLLALKKLFGRKH